MNNDKYNTMQNTSENKVETTEQPKKRPDDTGSVKVEGFVCIFDPNTKEKFVEQRA